MGFFGVFFEPHMLGLDIKGVSYLNLKESVLDNKFKPVVITHPFACLRFEYLPYSIVEWSLLDDAVPTRHR